MWDDPPPVIVAVRAMLAACPSWVAAGGAMAQVHYPGLPDLDPMAAPLPRVWISATASMARAFTGLSLSAHEIDISLEAWGRVAVALAAVGPTRLEVAGDHTAAIAVGAQVRIGAVDSALASWYTVDAIAYNGATGRTEVDTAEAVPDEPIAGAVGYYGRAESLGHAIARDLQELATGVWIESARVDLAASPRAGEIDDDYDTVRITLQTGLEVSV